MAPLKVIGAGFGRTGTLSLCCALDILGYTCLHMEKVLLDPTQNPDDFAQAYKNRDADWNKLFEGYDASVDWPSAEFWPELAQKYPEAEVILPCATQRVGTGPLARPSRSGRWTHRCSGRSAFKTRGMARAIVKEGALRDFADKDAMIAKFLENTERVKATIPAAQLLLLQSSEGWGPLCDFFGKVCLKLTLLTAIALKTSWTD